MIPATVKQLNAWIESSFQVLSFTRGWVSFPIHLTLEDDIEVITEKRIAALTIALTGMEEDCCKEIYTVLRAIPSLECLQDATTPLFVRTIFEWIPDSRIVAGRIAFWDKHFNEGLLRSRVYKPEGYSARLANRLEGLMR